MPTTDTPLRYPGGKSQLIPFVIDVMRENELFYGEYAEPFAGGAGIACSLLFQGYASRVHINDLDPAIYAFWHAAVLESEEFAKKVRDTPVTIKEWHRQRKIHHGTDTGILELGFSTFFLNRTNRSGIIHGGVIGGLKQDGKYPIDCRFHKENLLKKIDRLGQYADRISLTNMDALAFLRQFKPANISKTLINIDPPYYVRGPELYGNWFDDDDHAALSRSVSKIKPFWMITYDNVDQIKELYEHLPSYPSQLRYSAQVKRNGHELMVLDPRLNRPASLSRIAKAPEPKYQRKSRAA